MLNKLLLLNPLSLSAALALAAVGTASFLPAAEAAMFNFSYTLINGSILSGMMEGDIQADNDTVFVSAVTMPMFNGVPGPALPFVISITKFFGGPATPATVSFSGSTMDLLACDNIGCNNPGGNDAFAFVPPSPITSVPLYSGGPSYGAALERYNAANWKLTQKVPEPSATLGLVAIGIIGAVSRRKRK